jgi:lipid-binding SYLF domain-containing protein
MIGYVDLSQATIGAQIGGQKYSEIIFFENATVLESFKKGEFTFAAQATAVAVSSGAGANAKYTNGVMVFTLGEKGLMAEASIGGQKFDFQPK